MINTYFFVVLCLFRKYVGVVKSAGSPRVMQGKAEGLSGGSEPSAGG